MKLSLGVGDVTINAVPEPFSSWDTFQVGEHLQKEYGLFQAFYDMNTNFINAEIAEAVAGRLETIALGGVISEDKIFLPKSRDLFRSMLTEQKFDSALWAVPVQAALDGYHRGKKTGNPKGRPRKGATRKVSPPRPSFVDTGVFRNSVNLWIEL